MITTTLRVITVCAGLIWAAITFAAAPINESRDLNAGASLNVENVVGSVTITGWDQNRVELTGTLGEDVEELVIEGDADELEIRVELPDQADNAEETHLELKAPAGVKLDVETVSADVTARHLTGPVSINTISGDTIANLQSPNLSLQNVSGDMVFEGRADRLDFKTVSGDIEAHITGGEEMNLATVSGDAELNITGTLGELEMETISGELTASFAADSVPEMNISSLSGELVLVLPASVGARIEARSFSGEISSEFDNSDHESGELDVTLGDGGPMISIGTFSGEVEIRKQ